MDKLAMVIGYMVIGATALRAIGPRGRDRLADALDRMVPAVLAALEEQRKR